MAAKLRLCAVSYLNTAPLVWGMSQGPQRGLYDLSFTLPSVCADRLKSGEADGGLVPVIELAHQPDLEVTSDACIACDGRVRSILLVAKKPFGSIESFAADTGSRTSVVLTQIVAAQKHGLRPRMIRHQPCLNEMLEIADAALIIGDPALRIDPLMATWRGRPVHVYDLGAEWAQMTALPMVFAVWGVKRGTHSQGLGENLSRSAAYGMAHIDEIVSVESARLSFEPRVVREYLTRYICYQLGESQREAMDLFLRLAEDLGLVEEHAQLRFLP